jgi:predicted RNA binding protein YcfA (HicA-like mRNA interferase family)
MTAVPGTGRSRIMRGMSREMPALIRGAVAEGWRLETPGGSHLRLRHPSGGNVVVSSTLSDNWRGIRNVRAELRRQARGVPA